MMSNLSTPLILCLWICLAHPSLTNAQVKTFTGAHYQLMSDFPDVEAQELLLVIESAWPQLKDFFGKEPKLKKNERLSVFLFEKYESFVHQMQKQGVIPPGPGAGGYYWPPLETVYQYRQPTVFYTRQLLIHECVHQFHFLSSTNNLSPRDDWFVEGLTEYVSRHSWDGKILRLRSIPTMSLKDFPAQALKIMSAPNYDLRAMVSSQNKSQRAEQWALIHWLCRQDKKAQKKWKKISRGLNKLQPASKITRLIIGDPKKTKKALLTWLRSHQEPMKQVFNQWEGQAPHRIRGFAGVVTMCRTKDDCQTFEANLIVPKGSKHWNGGLLLQFEDAKNYTLLLVRKGKWKIDQLKNGLWFKIAKDKNPTMPPNDRLFLAAKRKGKTIQVFIGDTMIKEIQSPPSPMGLCLDDCTSCFDGVKWTSIL